MAAVRVWSLAQRLLHWALALSVVAAFATHEGGGSWHEWTGYAALAIALIRIAMGLGSYGFAGAHAPFASFVKAPAATLSYARAVLARREPRTLGHNPLGAWMVLSLLATTVLASASGWLYTTDQFWGMAWLERVHSLLGNAFIPLVALHLCGVAYTSWRHRENLVKSMLTGEKSAEQA